MRGLLDALGLGLLLARQHRTCSRQLAAEQGEGEVVAVEFAQPVDLATRLLRITLVDGVLDFSAASRKDSRSVCCAV